MPLYRLILTLLSPLIAVRFLIRMIGGRETRGGLAQRLGRGQIPKNPAPTIWLHGASLGELTAARPFLIHLLNLHPNLHAVVTCNTYTALNMVQGWQPTGRIHPRLAPLDYKSCMQRFLNNWHPRAAFTLENEIWPNRSLACQSRNIPLIVLGGRMSARSAKIWNRFAGLSRQVMGAISALSPLDDENARRFLSLGLEPAKIGQSVNLKSSVKLAPPDPDQLARFAAIYPRQTTILAASTHAGEEETVLAAFKTARAQNPALRLILAPRHPQRADTVAQLVTQAGFNCTRRSHGAEPDIGTDVYLADTTGEMPLWYSLASLTFLGASLTDKGGHTPVEPVQFGSIVLHGPHISNHKGAYAALGKNGAFCANTREELAQLFIRLTTSPPQDVPGRAQKALAALADSNANPAALLAEFDKITDGKLLPILLG